MCLQSEDLYSDTVNVMELVAAHIGLRPFDWTKTVGVKFNVAIRQAVCVYVHMSEKRFLTLNTLALNLQGEKRASMVKEEATRKKHPMSEETRISLHNFYQVRLVVCADAIHMFILSFSSSLRSSRC